MKIILPDGSVEESKDELRLSVTLLPMYCTGSKETVSGDQTGNRTGN